VLLGVDLPQDELRAPVLLAPAGTRVRADEPLAVRDQVLGAVLLGFGVEEDGDVGASAFHERLVPAPAPG
jgi:hypothetical protein